MLIVNNRKEDFMNDNCFDNNIDKYPLAIAYVPWQQLTNIYENLEEAYEIGTIFPELTKPFTGRRCVN